MLRDSQLIATQLIKSIMDCVWVGVAGQVISKKLALVAAKLQTLQFASSYVENATENKQLPGKLICDKDPVSIPMDNFATGQLQKQIINKQKVRKVSLVQSVNQTRTRKFTMQSNLQKKTIDNQKEHSQQNKYSTLITLGQKQDPHQVKDPEEEKCRTFKFRSEKQQKDMKKLLSDRTKERSQNSLKSKKAIKQLKKYTYDYDGSFFGIGANNATNQKVLKLEKNSGEQELINKQMKNPEQKVINNEKIKERETRNAKGFLQNDKNQPIFDQKRPESLVDFFQQGIRLSEGIKLIGEKGKQKIIKQKARRKLSGMKQYKKSQYQNITKDKKFKDYKKAIINTSAPALNALDLDHSNEDLKEFNLINENNRNHEVILNKGEDISSVLPPINSNYLKKNSKFFTNKIFGPYLISSRSMAEYSVSSSKKSSASFIKIDHQSLYSQNFRNNYNIE